MKNHTFVIGFILTITFVTAFLVTTVISSVLDMANGTYQQGYADSLALSRGE